MLKNIVLVLLGGIGGAAVVLGVMILLKSDTASPVVPPTGSGTTLEYNIPDQSEIDDLANIEIPNKTQLGNTLEIELPEQTVSAAYTKAFNNTMNMVVDIELQVKSNVASAMTQVQQGALSGDWINLFQYMADAKNETAKAQALAVELRAATDALESELLASPLEKPVQDATVAYIANLKALAVSTDELAVAFNAGLQGRVPTQAEVDEAERQQIVFDSHITQLVKDIRMITDVIKSVTQG